MPLSVQNIFAYVCSSIAFLIAVFCLFKVMNTSRKINSLADFIHGEVFSVRFESLLTAFFADEKNTKIVLEPVLPWLRDGSSVPNVPPLEKAVFFLD
jgi:hypothetical protein